MSSIGQSMLMALTVTVNKYASSNLQAVHKTQGKAANPTTHTLSTNVEQLGRRGLVLSTVIATTQVPDSRTELLKSIHYLKFLLSWVCYTSYLTSYSSLANSNNVIVMKLLSEYLKKSEENKEKNDKEVSKWLAEYLNSPQWYKGVHLNVING